MQPYCWHKETARPGTSEITELAERAKQFQQAGSCLPFRKWFRHFAAQVDNNGDDGGWLLVPLPPIKEGTQ